MNDVAPTTNEDQTTEPKTTKDPGFLTNAFNWVKDGLGKVVEWATEMCGGNQGLATGLLGAGIGALTGGGIMSTIIGGALGYGINALMNKSGNDKDEGPETNKKVEVPQPGDPGFIGPLPAPAGP